MQPHGILVRPKRSYVSFNALRYRIRLDRCVVLFFLFLVYSGLPFVLLNRNGCICRILAYNI